MKRTGLWLAIFLVVTALAYTGLFLSLSNPAFIDAPNHLARAVIMNSLWQDPHSPFQGMFSASHIFVPYMLADLCLIFLLRGLGANAAYTVWSTLTVLVLVIAIWIYARQILTTSWAVAAAVLCSWYFATSYYLILGLFAFQWGLASAFIALAALEAWRRNGGNKSGWIAAYVVACLACYAMHIAVFAIVAGMVGAVGLVRVFRKEQSWVRLLGELLPFALLAAYHFPFVPAGPDNVADRTTQLGSISNLFGPMFPHPGYMLSGLIQLLGGGILAGVTWFKIGSFIVSMFVRQSYWLDGAILVLFWAIVAGAMRLGWRRTELRSNWQLVAVCVLAAALYFLLPFWWEAVAYVDQRALPFLFIPLLMLSLRIFETSNPVPKQISFLIIACCLLATLNFASLARFLPRQSRQVARYREALLAIPEGQVVLAVDARRRDGNTYPLRHAGAFYAADRHGYTPYIFSNRTGSGPAEYFSDLSSIYRPSQRWYRSNAECDWEKVAENYDYIIITKPWRADRIDFSRLELRYENPVATVFQVRRVTAPATP